ncbi:MAG: hypothetical protein ACO2OQ_01280 [Thermofilaceae archaeon]|jgi:prefoldin subunit 5
MATSSFRDAERKLRDLYSSYEEKLRGLEKRLSELEEKARKHEVSFGELVGELRSLRFEARSLLGEYKLESKRLLKELSAGLAGEEVEELEDLSEDLLEDLEDGVEELLERTEEARRLARPREVRREIRIEIPEIRLPDIGRIVEESLSAAWRSSPSAVVSSTRILQADLKVIDALVEAGVFRSRNEGIAYFVHRGIECSREWLEKIRAKVEEIRRLQEEIQKELEGFRKEEGSQEGSSRFKVKVE